MELFPGSDFAKWVCAAKYKSSTSQRSTKLSFVQNEIAKITDRPVSTTPITIYVANLDFHLNKHRNQLVQLPRAVDSRSGVFSTNCGVATALSKRDQSRAGGNAAVKINKHITARRSHDWNKSRLQRSSTAESLQRCRICNIAAYRDSELKLRVLYCRW